MSGAAENRHLVFAIPGDLNTASGGYGYDRRMIAELRALGWTVDHLQLPAGFPDPSAADLALSAGQLADLPENSLVLLDGLAFGAMPQIALNEKQRLRMVALVHHPLALETGITAETAQKLTESETTALGATRGVVVTSPATARTLVADFGVSDEHIHIALPGTEQAAPAGGSAARTECDGPLILSVGSLTPRKDHATLVSALAQLADRAWQCRIVGSDRMNPQSAAALRQQIAKAGLVDRIVVTGEVEDVSDEYDHADIFALASRYEGFGMAFAEAMVRGLPIVGCHGGAIPDLVDPRAGILVEPGNVTLFADALARLIDNPQQRSEFANGSLATGLRLPDWPKTAATLSDFLKGIS
ncbi:glycosyltransferase involved in cell wall biosynthesis [Neorhizobium huautlense]|uniref:Glycosyltransferase involved in cell wall biosynthesis n=1 Tax=Neorhizobium huautlense TaxID=67774 RepID=A0ABT9PP67_9HYPH|nr:glycosyltransferase family 4 protein [Neorhizobium huautlense]MDP9836267.1 glycosyltransferase involved in cell wall biosynthesis [Neorhizobium huautlense]